MSQTLILGGAGFIGSNLTRALVARGERPRVLTRPSPAVGNLRDLLGQVDLVYGDFMDEMVMRSALTGIDTVYHLVTTTFPNMVRESSVYDLLSNLLPTIRLLQLSLELKVKRIVYASSGGTIYGEPLQMPISEEHPLVPKSAYGQSKLTIENYLAFYGRTTELEVSILRLSNPYGPRQNPLGVQGVIAVAMGCAMDGRPMTLFGRGEAVRDYIYIDDIIEAMLLAATHPPAVLNVSSGIGRSVAEVTDEVERVSGRRIERVYAPPRPGDVSANVLDNRRAQALLNWRPQIDFVEGVGRSWHWLSHLRQ